MNKSLSQYTFPLRLLAKIPFLGWMLQCLGKKQPNRSAKFAVLNVGLLLFIAVLLLGQQALLWSAGVIALFVVLVLLALGYDYIFGTNNSQIES